MTALRSAFRRTVKLLAGGIALASSISACGGQTNHDGDGQGDCPANLPAAGTTCAGNSSCSYASCQTTGQPDKSAHCINGVWQIDQAKMCPSACPGTFPIDGAACSVPSGVVCKYPQACCSDNVAQCVDGHWQGQAVFCGAPQPDPCPVNPPLPGSSCAPQNPCGGSPQYCAYGDCGGSPATVATCDGSVWQVQNQICLPSCETLSACECFARPDCQALSDGCLCQCDFQCTGEPACACDCGGGTYLGCTSALDK